MSAAAIFSGGDEILHPHWYRQEWPYFLGSLGWPFWPSGWPFRPWPCTWCAWWLWNLQWPQLQLANLGWPASSKTWQVAQPPVLDPWMGLAPTHEESTRCWQGACMCLDVVGQVWLAGCFWAQQVFAPADSAFPLEGPLCPPWGGCWGFPSPPPLPGWAAPVAVLVVARPVLRRGPCNSV